MIETLTTRRLELRPWRLEDATDLYAVARDPQVGPAAGWPPHRSVEESAEVIRTVFASPETYAVVLRESGRPVGCVGLLFPSSSHFRLGATEAEVGYWIGTSWRGRGLMPEALGEMVRRAFEELELTALWGSCFVGNEASRRVMEKCGFRYLRTESGLQDLAGGLPQMGEILCLSRDEWQALQHVYLRRASESDIPLIRQVAEVAFPATYREILTPSQLDYMMDWMYSEESLRTQFREGHCFYLAFLDGAPCGYVSVEREGEALFYLQKIYVLPQAQGHGIGGRLFRQAVAHVRRLSPTPCRLELNVNRHNRALHFYEHMGMRRLREGDFPIGGGFYMNDYIMGLDIA